MMYKKNRFFVNAKILATLLLFIIGNITLYAQSTKTWVSGVGDDANPCSRNAPCKTFAGAISKTAAGGEITVLDPGGYGALTITKSITISGISSHASILVAGTNGIRIVADVNDVVNLRNISIFGSTSTLSGIKYEKAKVVNIENCNINNFALAGIEANLTTAGATVGILNITNTIITSSISTSMGILLSTNNDSLLTTINNVKLNGFYTAISDSLNSRVMISNSVISNCQTGIKVLNASVLNSINCDLNNNFTAINSVDATSIIRLSNTNIYNNTIGVTGLGKIYSFGDNSINGNNTNSNTVFSILKTQ